MLPQAIRYFPNWHISELTSSGRYLLLRLIYGCLYHPFITHLIFRWRNNSIESSYFSRWLKCRRVTLRTTRIKPQNATSLIFIRSPAVSQIHAQPVVLFLQATILINLRDAGIIGLLRLFNIVQMINRPVIHGAERFLQRAAQIGNGVFHCNRRSG